MALLIWILMQSPLHLKRKADGVSFFLKYIASILQLFKKGGILEILYNLTSGMYSAIEKRTIYYNYNVELQWNNTTHSTYRRILQELLDCVKQSYISHKKYVCRMLIVHYVTLTSLELSEETQDWIRYYWDIAEKTICYLCTTIKVKDSIECTCDDTYYLLFRIADTTLWENYNFNRSIDLSTLQGNFEISYGAIPPLPTPLILLTYF